MAKHVWWLVGAALLVADPAAARGVAVDQATEGQVETARVSYVEGKAAYDARDYETALGRFRASYEVVASPNSHLMIAKCLLEVERLAEAYREAKVAVEEAEAAAKVVPKYEKTAVDARAQLEQLRGKIGFVSVRVLGVADPEATLTVAGESVPLAAAAEPVAVSPGLVTVSLDSARGRVERSIQVGAGGNALIEIPTTPTPTDTGDAGDGGDEGFAIGTPRTIGLVAGGVGLAGMVTFAIFGSMAASSFGDLEDQCPDKRCPADLAGDADSGKTYQTVANVGLVIGIAGLIGGTALFLLEPEIDSEDEPPASALRFGVGPGSLRLSGSF